MSNILIQIALLLPLLWLLWPHSRRPKAKRNYVLVAALAIYSAVAESKTPDGGWVLYSGDTFTCAPTKLTPAALQDRMRSIYGGVAGVDPVIDFATGNVVAKDVYWQIAQYNYGRTRMFRAVAACESYADQLSAPQRKEMPEGRPDGRE